MNRPEFERRLADLRERIASLPAERRTDLEALATETSFRHASIVHHSVRATRAAERLQRANLQLGEACTRLTGRVEDLRFVLAGPREDRPGPGLN